VGIGPTKVLAKAANRIATRNPETGGVLDLAALGPHVDAHLERIAVRDVWGIGKRWAEKLEQLGIGTAAALRDADPSLVRRRCGVVANASTSCAASPASPRRSRSAPAGTDLALVRRVGATRTCARPSRPSPRTAKAARRPRPRPAHRLLLTCGDHRTPQYSNAATVPLPRATRTPAS
jgi:DNA polymerase V